MQERLDTRAEKDRVPLFRDALQFLSDFLETAGEDAKLGPVAVALHLYRYVVHPCYCRYPCHVPHVHARCHEPYTLHEGVSVSLVRPL